jgi:deoxyxylulose-5-phosphate synthase
VVEFAADRDLGVAIERIGVPNILIQHDKQPNQRASFGLSAENVAARVRSSESAAASRA